MAFAFDTLGYSKALRAAGISTEHAEAHAEAAREFIMHELVTKQDFHTGLDNLRTELRSAMELQTLQMTIRLGGLVGGGIAIIAALIKLA